MENNNTNFEIKVLEFEHKGNEIVPLVLEKSIYLTSNDKIRANIEIQEVKGCEVKWYLRLNDKTIEEVVRKKSKHSLTLTNHSILGEELPSIFEK